MARGTRIIVSDQPKGHMTPLYVKTGQTIYPGMLVQKDLSVALKGGRESVIVYDADADGGRPKGGAVYIATNEIGGGAGRDATTQIPAGEQELFYTPLPGDELNLLILNIAGTADDHAIGEVLIADDTTGKFIATTGSPETEMAVLKEAITDPTADTLAWCEWTGYTFWWLAGLAASMAAAILGSGAA